MKPFYLLILLMVGGAYGQSVHLTGGASSLFGGSGGGAAAYFSNHQAYVGAADADGHLAIGLSDSFKFHESKITLGDNLINYSMDGGGLGVQVRGVTVERKGFSFFAGATGVSYLTPFFQTISPRHFGTGFYYKRDYRRWKFRSLNLIDGNKKSSFHGASFETRKIKLSLAGGLLMGRWQFNTTGQVQVKHFRASATHLNLGDNLLLDSVAGGISGSWAGLHAMALRERLSGISTNGQTIGGSLRWKFLTAQSDYYRSQGRAQILHTIIEHSRHFDFSQAVNQTSKQLSLSGGYHNNRFSVSVSQSLVLIPSQGYKRITFVSLSIRIPHTQSSVNLASNVGLDGKVRYSAYADGWTYGPYRENHQKRIKGVFDLPVTK